MERIDKIFCLGNFGIEFVKVGKNLYKYYGGSGYRFSLFASFYSPLVVFSIAGPYKKWQKIIKLLQSYKVDTRNIIHSQKEIKFITSYDSKREKQVNYEIKNRDIMRKMCKFSNKLKFQKGVLFHICPLDFEVQRKYVEMAKKKSALVSMQFHFSSINGKKTEDYVNLIKKVDYLFLNKKEAFKISNKKKIIQAGIFLSLFCKKYVFITNAEKELFVFKSGKVYLKMLPIPVLKPVNVEGAGDAFAAGVVAGLKCQKELKKALLWGLMNANISIQFKSLDEIFNYLDRSSKNHAKNK